ncbi:MAG TPA: dihydrodipicolinate synthase family protein [Gemmatimonadaceae bacterium]|nr:dihydrodipicolinate synthase family protein [Gemmatimonadaceae bacterium]
MNLSAIFGPITTPFDSRGDVDFSAAASNCRALVKQGVDGIVIAGSTGEAALLDELERTALLETIRKAIPSNRILMGVGAESTRQTIERAKAAAIGGADAVLCVAPHYYGAAMNDSALRAHYHAVADASPKPVVLYTIPKYMHFALSASLVAELARHPNVIGIKDSSGDPAILNGYLQAQSDSFTVLTGNGAQWLNALRAGARGGILAVALFAPQLARTVFESHKAGRVADADGAQAKLTPLAVEIVGKMGIGAIKVACEATGFEGGPVRSPLTNPDDATRKRVLELLDASGLQRKAAAAA